MKQLHYTSKTLFILSLMLTFGLTQVWGQTNITSLSQITDADGHYIITQDISGGTPGVTTFNGTLEANFDPDTHMPYKITGLGAPLFTTLTGTVKNLVLEDVNISSGDNVGAIAGTANGSARVYNVGILSGSVGGTGYTGGLIGLLDGTARVINCYSYANITAGSEKAGIVGYNRVTSTQSSLTTMVMNCMFYGDISSGGTISPIYGGVEINNVAGGMNNYNYYRYESPYSKNKLITKYNRALAMEEKFINRFERYRLLLNSNKKLAAKYASTATTTVNPNDMAKWVLETADRTINEPNPYPILKAQGYYPSIINPDIKNAPDSATVGRNKGGKLNKTLTVTISTSKTDGGQSWPDGADITTTSLTLQRTDKDFDHFNFNYDKVQLPYYNDVGTGNYTGSRVVTGWKITSITGGTSGTYNEADEWGGYNFADRKCTNKDLYGTNGSYRVFSQGAYWDVPEGVTAITIEPYWAIANYVSDDTYDVVYNNSYGKQSFSLFGTQYNNNTNIDIYNDGNNNQKVYTTISNALTGFDNSSKTVYDQAVVLVGNVHQADNPTFSDIPYTLMSIDLNHDNEPDYSYIFGHNDRQKISPIRYDFLNIVGIAEAQIPKNASTFRNVSIFKIKGWFEITNTCLVHFEQFEYDNGDKSAAPLILLGGSYKQFVSTKVSKPTATKYIHVGGNAWYAKFGNGTHSDGTKSTKHIPISVTGGDYDEFYLSGTYQPTVVANQNDPAECYVSGGRFGEMAGASLEQIDGNVRWQIDWADITNFFGGGINANKPITGSIQTDITNSHVTLFCGGPKFGDMSAGKTVITNANNCTFGTYCGAGYGGTSLNRVKYYDIANWNPKDKQGDYANDRGKYFDGATTKSPGNNGQYGKKGKGVATDFDYDFFYWSSGKTGGRFYVKFASFSLATTNGVTSNLNGCNITGNFYGGGYLGKVNGTATSTLYSCKVEGSVYGGGYSASLPPVYVRNTPAFTQDPGINNNIGMFDMGEINTLETYTWKQVDKSVLKNGESGMESSGLGNFVYTDEDLTSLGYVGKTVLNIKGSTTVGGSVYGGGEESNVDGNTEVIVKGGGTIGTTGLGGALYGNVYGGGKGKVTDVKSGLVKGNTNVTIQDTIVGGNTISPKILHNVYGGGAYGSVGTYVYDNAGNITSYTSGGTANVTITGGIIGTTGDENGMVYGSSRGDVGAPGEIHDRLAWVHDAHVVIGTEGQGTTLTSPLIKGSVYGSGENGHTYENTLVDIHSGTIGITSGSPISSGGVEYTGANYPYRGNVYGGGCGTDKYDSDNDGILDSYNPLAGIVLGNASVNVTGGLVAHNLYGAGAMGSVGTMTKDNTGAITITNGGVTSISISGGTIGVDGIRNGSVFGAARGDSISTQTDAALAKTTNVTISDAAVVKGNVYGGGEAGDVGTYTTNVDGSNTYIGGSGVCNVTITGGTIGAEGNGFGNVFGAGKGASNTFECRKAMVNTTIVNISDGTVYGSVFGGGEIARVEGNTAVTLGVEGASGGGYAPDIKGDVYGAGAGLSTHGYSALVRGNPVVSVQGLTKVGGSVYGGGDIASVGKHSLVTLANKEEHPNLEVGMPFTLANTNLGICTVTVKDNAEILGSVFGAGKGVDPGAITNPGRMKPDNSMEYYNNNGEPGSYGEGYENALLIYVQTLALATDTHLTVNGNAKVKGSVYGGSESGFVQFNSYVNIQGSCQIGTTDAGGNVFGGGLGLQDNAAAGRVSGNTSLNIGGGTMYGSVYGGGAYGYVGTYTVSADGRDFTWHTLHDAKTGICDVNITGGTIGSEGVTGKGNVFGASKGLANSYQCEKAMVDSTNVNISNGTVYGSVYGGGEIARVEGNTEVTIGVAGATGEGVAPDIRCSVFGAGAGVETHGYSALVRGNTAVLIQGRTKIGQNVYGGGEIASVGKYKVANADTLAKYPELVAAGIKIGMPYALTNDGLGICRVTVKDVAKIGPDNIGHVFGAGKGIVPHYDGTNKRMTFNNNNESVWETFASEEDYMKFVETMALVTKTFVDIDGSAFVKGSVYGGSESGFVQDNTQVTIQGSSCQIGTADTGGNVYGGGLGIEGNAVAGRVLGNTTLYIINGTMYGSVYGGGEAGIVWKDTYVNLTGGTVIHDAYGGGLAADVEGNTNVSLNENVADDACGCVVSRIFGCNNVSGTPKGTVTVHVFKTQKAGATRITNPVNGPATAKVLGEYDVAAVYGGGNLAAYEPTNAFLDYATNKALVDAAYTHVIIDGCDRTSIAQVYGGGNAASTPGTFVEINGTFEIGEVFGGGNGKDSIVVSGVLKENPGANIGYKDYSAVEDSYDTKDKRAEDPFKSYIYGSGQVKVVVHGGLIHAVYGGSNTKGNLRQTAMVILSEKDEADDDYCCFNVGEAYGGGKSADMDAETIMTMDCIPGLDIVYGGAENADVVGGATLNITNGRYGQVFGGNNRGGRIGGSIVVNIEETGCRPIIIGELFGGGNRAAYSIYGYTEKKDGNGDLILDVDGKIQWLPLKSTDAGALSSPYDSPHVNVKSFTSIGDIYGGGYGETAVMIGSPVVNINEVVGGKTNHSQANIATEGTITISEELTPGVVTTRELKYPPHTQGAIGSINNVFGGGNEAEVVGDTYVNIGTEEKIQYVTGADTETKITVKGVNILGNVYGGGNKANVTGQTNVTIGKSE